MPRDTFGLLVAVDPNLTIRVPLVSPYSEEEVPDPKSVRWSPDRWPIAVVLVCIEAALERAESRVAELKEVQSAVLMKKGEGK